MFSELTRKQSGSSMTPAALAALPSVSLTWRERQRSRLAVITDTGEAAAILLARGTTLADGDVLTNEAGDQIRVHAAPESLLEITAQTPFQLLRLVYHLANRHVSAMLTSQAVYIEPDPVLAEMVVRLGGAVSATERPFEPEKGAYLGTSDHAQPHSHPEDGAAGRHRHTHGELDEIDRVMGNVGEELSRKAHEKS